MDDFGVSVPPCVDGVGVTSLGSDAGVYVGENAGESMFDPPCAEGVAGVSGKFSESLETLRFRCRKNETGLPQVNIFFIYF